MRPSRRPRALLREPALCNLTHGDAVGVMLPHVIRFNVQQPEMAAKQWTAQFNPRLPSVEDFVELYCAAF